MGIRKEVVTVRKRVAGRGGFDPRSGRAAALGKASPLMTRAWVEACADEGVDPVELSALELSSLPKVRA